ncbi:MAG: glycosyltransferase family 4 protein [Opitutales bacterium]
MKLFIAIDAYQPGFRFGGPVRSLTNLVDWLGERYEIYIFTKDRDLGDTQGYVDLLANQWVSCGSAKVFYASPDQHSAARARAELAAIAPDVVYLNGLWEGMTRGLLKARLPGARYVIAPRGALGAGALAIKPLKKKLGLLLMRSSLRGLVWHVTAESEAAEVRKVIGSQESICMAANLLEQRVGDAISNLPLSRSAGPTRLVAFSRLSRKKNFDFLLGCLRSVNSAFSLDIIGPEEDPAYASELKELAKQLGPNQAVHFLGGKSPAELTALLPKYDFFVLPTQHENFGHVFIEAWAAGLPVITSDQTPWRDLQAKGIGWDLPLSKRELWIELLETIIQIQPDELMKLKMQSARFVADLAQQQPLDAYKRLFEGCSENPSI